MTRYHAVRMPTVKPSTTTHHMTREEKAEAIRRFEEKNKALFDLGRPEREWHEETLLLPNGQVQIYSTPQPIKTWKEFNQRLDALVEQSDKLLQQLKDKFGE